MFLVIIIIIFIWHSWKASSSNAVQNCIPDIGTVVMGWVAEREQWCRSQVIKICGMSRGGFCPCVEMFLQMYASRW